MSSRPIFCGSPRTRTTGCRTTTCRRPYLRMNQLDRAVDEGHTAVKLAPTSLVAYQQLTRALLAQDQVVEAKELIRKAAADGLDSSAMRALAFDLAFVDKDSGAMQEHLRAAATRQDELLIVTEAARAAAATGDIDASRTPLCAGDRRRPCRPHRRLRRQPDRGAGAERRPGRRPRSRPRRDRCRSCGQPRPGHHVDGVARGSLRRAGVASIRARKGVPRPAASCSRRRQRAGADASCRQSRWPARTPPRRWRR